jgi:hypothetical protein
MSAPLSQVFVRVAGPDGEERAVVRVAFGASVETVTLRDVQEAVAKHPRVLQALARSAPLSTSSISLPYGLSKSPIPPTARIFPFLSVRAAT